MKSERIVLLCTRNEVESFIVEISINIFEVDCEVQNSISLIFLGKETVEIQAASFESDEE
jgi:hypothetical protein